jgi:uncharacterized membrane protein
MLRTLLAVSIATLTFAASGCSSDKHTDAPADSGPSVHDASGAAFFRVIAPVPNQLQPPGGHTPLRRTYFQALTDDGSVVLGGSEMFDAPDGSIVGEGTEAFRWTAEGGTVGLGFLPECDRKDPFLSQAQASAMNSDGSILLGSCTATAEAMQTNPLFRWTQASGLARIDGPPGLSIARWSALSSDGSVGVGIAQPGPVDGTLPSQTFRWTQATGAIGLGTLPGADESDPYGGVTRDGKSIVGHSGNDIFRWTEATGMVALPRPTGFDQCMPALARGDIDAALVVGRCSNATTSQYFVWIGSAAPKQVSLPPGAIAADDPGVALGGDLVYGTLSYSGDKRRGFRWTEATGSIELGFDGYESCGVAGRPYLAGTTSADGKVLIGDCGSLLDGGAIARKAFRWTESSGIAPLAPLPGYDGTMSRSLSADGSIITGQSTNSTDPADMVGVVWDRAGTPTSFIDLLTSSGIDAQGFKTIEVIVSPTDSHLFYGLGTTPGRELRAWIARLP